MEEELKTSVKSLGELAMDTCCLRCYWLKQRVGYNKSIWGHHSPIYNALDRFEKRHVDWIIAETGKGPGWLLHGDEVVESTKIERLKFHVPGPPVLVRGEPDALLKCSDGKYLLVDHKTSKFKGTDDPFFPQYEVQLNSYRTILERVHAITIKKMLLSYASIQADADAAADVVALDDQGFRTRFVVNNLPVEADDSLLLNMAHQAIDLYRQEEPPDSLDGCTHCKTFRQMLEALGDAAHASDRYIDPMEYEVAEWKRADAKARRWRVVS